ncbi:MAG: hypothetical protein NVSMB27_16410 [Ktedonobacteraceae bacterium]
MPGGIRFGALCSKPDTDVDGLLNACGLSVAGLDEKLKGRGVFGACVEEIGGSGVFGTMVDPLNEGKDGGGE